MQKVAANWVWVNERGDLVGESHPGAVLTDHDIDLMHELRDSDPKVWSYAKLAEKFEVSKSCVSMIFSGRRRGQAAHRRRARGPSARR